MSKWDRIAYGVAIAILTLALLFTNKSIMVQSEWMLRHGARIKALEDYLISYQPAARLQALEEGKR